MGFYVSGIIRAMNKKITQAAASAFSAAQALGLLYEPVSA